MMSISRVVQCQSSQNLAVKAQYKPTARIHNSITAVPKTRRHLGSVFNKRTAHIANAGKIKIVTEQELEVEVANRECPMIIDFFATWCGPCVLLAKELEQVAEELGDQIKIIKIDCDENEAISSALQIQGLPTLIFIGMDPQKPALRTEGLLPAQAIIDIVQKELLAPAADA